MFLCWINDLVGVKKMSKRKAKFSGIGGQAVLEGIMMRNGKRYAVAVRKQAEKQYFGEYARGEKVI